VIQVRNLTKVFVDGKRGRITAVDHISFEVQEGEIFGLLGPNGAGKTTALRMLATVMKPTEGSAMLGGHDVIREPEQVRKMIGFQSGDMGLYHRLTPREILSFFAKLHGMNGAHLKSRIEEMVSLVGIQDFADTKVDKLSTGTRQKVAIARTLIHDPAILILDEPASGLDVPTARVIEEFILVARKSGKSILLSTHVMEEAEYLCDRIAVIDRGKIKIVGAMAELRAATGKERLREVFLELLGMEGRLARRSGDVS